MSADNYGIIHRHGDGWGITMGFASDDREPNLDRPYFTAPTLAEVEAHADDEYFEYGVTVHDPDSLVLRLTKDETHIVRSALDDFVYDCEESIEVGDFTGPENDELRRQADLARTIILRMEA